jgi:hypothetical protein
MDHDRIERIIFTADEVADINRRALRRLRAAREGDEEALAGLAREEEALSSVAQGPLFEVEKRARGRLF